MRHLLSVSLLLACSSSWLLAQEPLTITSEPVEAIVAGITDRELGGHMMFLSSDLMRGRDTASPEIRLAAEYLAAHLFCAGAEPAGDREGDDVSYFARFPLELTTPRAEGTSLTLIVEQDGVLRESTYELNSDFFLNPRGIDPGSLESPVVFAGYGIVSEESGRDDFEGLNINNRLVLVLDGIPPIAEEAAESETRERGRRSPRLQGSAFAKLANAQERGALGLLVIHPFGTDAGPYEQSQAFSQRAFDRQSMALGAATKALPVFYLEDHVRDDLDIAADLSAEVREPGELQGVRFRYTFQADREVVHDRNVVGLFPGSDPEKAREVIVFSAHYDHVGVNADGEIFNGSDDNASGTSALLEIAQAFGDGPRPARSVAFLWVSGEEKGLLGSRWWSENMTLPQGYEVVANINMDMISRNDPGKISLTPSSSHQEYSTLIPTAISVCEAEGIEAVFDADQFFNRTDSANFARKGIPIVFFFCGIHEDYHQPTDTFEKSDLEKSARVARAAYRLGWAVAQADEVPKKLQSGEEADAIGEAGAASALPAEAAVSSGSGR
ncbi:M20/M25/M40 family metallo-hydrolase [soil metagenome]